MAFSETGSPVFSDNVTGTRSRKKNIGPQKSKDLSDLFVHSHLILRVHAKHLCVH